MLWDFRHPFFWTGGMTTNFFQNAYYFKLTDTYKKETFPIKSVGNPDSDRSLLFQKRGGIPRYSHSASESFVSGVNFRLFSIVHLILRESLTPQINKLTERGEVWPSFEILEH